MPFFPVPPLAGGLQGGRLRGDYRGVACGGTTGKFFRGTGQGSRHPLLVSHDNYIGPHQAKGERSNMANKKKGDNHSPIFEFTYKDKRTNIPTHELRDFVAAEEKQPKTVLYPRDLSLDPQLVWKGKDEQDSQDFAVPAVPIYIQEKILPKAIIEEVRAQAKKDKPEQTAFAF